MKAFKKVLALCLVSVLLLGVTACGGGGSSDSIHVISREEGSGTRGAFVELMGILSDSDEDMTVGSAEIASGTSTVMTTVAGNESAIGYISLGSLNDTVKAISVDGVAPTVENIGDGSYKVARPFNIATKGAPTAEAQDFIDFIMSTEGQDIVEETGFIRVADSGAFSGGSVSGTVVVSGSTSVAPVMEKLKEAYEAINGNLSIEIQQGGSTAGMTGAIDGTCDIGMASRELKDSEKAELTPIVIAQDGIAIVVNNASAIENLSAEQVKGIYTGEITAWGDVQ